MATIAGAMTTTNVLSDQLAIDLGDNITLLEPDQQVLQAFTRRADKRKTVATKFSWLEDQHKARFAATSGTSTTTIQTITVAAGQGAYFAKWDQVLNTRTGEQFRVDAVAGDVLTTTRNIAPTGVGTGVAMNNADELYIIGSAQPENDLSKVPQSDVPSKVTNNTQITRTPFAISGSAKASGYQVSPAEWPRQQKMKAAEHGKDIELTFLFGKKSATTPGADEDRTTAGILSFITTNQTDAGGDLSEAEFNAAMMQFFRFGSRTKLAMCSGVGTSALLKFPASKQMVMSSETRYGMVVSTYESPFGTLKTVYHRLLEGTKYGGYIIVVDMDNVAYRYLGNDEESRDTKVLPNRQEPDRDGVKNEILTECGLECRLQRTHGVFTGITS